MNTQLRQFKESNMLAMVKLDRTDGMKSGVVIRIGESNREYMVMLVLNDTDISVIKHETGVRH